MLTSLNADFASLAGRAVIIAEFAQSETIEHRIEALAGLPQDSTVTSGVTGENATGGATTPPTFTGSGVPQVTYTADGASPIINIVTEGPPGDTAFRLAKAAQQALIEYTQSQRTTPGLTSSNTPGQTAQQREEARQLEALSTVRLRSVRSPSGGMIPPSTSASKAYKIGAILFVALCLVILLWDNFRTGRAAADPPGLRGEDLADRIA